MNPNDTFSPNPRPPILVSTTALPLACPPPNSPGMHPRVFLRFDEQHIAQCPYCGTRYRVDDPVSQH